MIAFLQEFAFELIFGVLSIISAFVINQMYHIHFKALQKKGEDYMPKETQKLVGAKISINIPPVLAHLFEDGKINIVDMVVIYHAVLKDQYTIEVEFDQPSEDEGNSIKEDITDDTSTKIC